MSAPQIIATGRCLPSTVVTNEDLSRQAEVSDEWIYSRTGIRTRYHCVEEQGIDLAEQAARQALERAGLTTGDIGVCLVATFSPDCASPSTACLLQSRLGLPEDTICFDLNAACAGFLYALNTAHRILPDAKRPYALVLGCEVISRVLDKKDRSTCALFGDGAGAVVLKNKEAAAFYKVFGSRGDAESIRVQGPGPETALVRMKGRDVFRFAVEVAEETISQLLDQAHLNIKNLDLVVCHQANGKIIDHLSKKFQAPPGLFYKNIERYGNTSAASIPIALDELALSHKLRPGMKVLLVGFGGGLTWTGVLLDW
ncbi:MAG: 3-oxoacyl-ACP synthase III family protein [Oscillospiraceae bacterium]|jgi:3-oxoacyl-[acyl-carrier-protein] synthase-3